MLLIKHGKHTLLNKLYLSKRWPLRAESKEHLGGGELGIAARQQSSHFTSGETEARRGEGPSPGHPENSTKPGLDHGVFIPKSVLVASKEVFLNERSTSREFTEVFSKCSSGQALAGFEVKR